MARSTTVRKKPAAASVAVAEPAIAKPKPAPVPVRRGRLYVVTRSRGSAWDPALPLERQYGWADHADYMNGLESEGFVVLGGPLDETPYMMLAVRAESEAEVKTRLAADPWEVGRVLETTRIAGWSLALGADKI